MIAHNSFGSKSAAEWQHLCPVSQCLDGLQGCGRMDVVQMPKIGYHGPRPNRHMESPVETPTASLEKHVPPTKEKPVALLGVSPANETSFKPWLSPTHRSTDKQFLKHIQVSLKLSIPEFVWSELAEFCVTGVIPLGQVSILKKSFDYSEIQSFSSYVHGRSSIPSDRLAREGEVHLKFEKLFDSIMETSRDFRGLGVSEEQISILMPRTRKIEILWCLNLEECIQVIQLSGKENILWEVRELAIGLREELKEGVIGFGHIAGLS